MREIFALGILLGVLGCGEIEEAGRPVAAKVATLIMSFDHRLVNGVGAASFINEVRSQIEASVPADSDQLTTLIKLRNVA